MGNKHSLLPYKRDSPDKNTQDRSVNPQDSFKLGLQEAKDTTYAMSNLMFMSFDIFVAIRSSLAIMIRISCSLFTHPPLSRREFFHSTNAIRLELSY